MNIREVARQVLNSDRYQHISECLGQLSCPYAIIKGQVLSTLCYNSPEERVSSDVDILIPRKNINEVENSLIQNGFHSCTDNRSDRITLLMASHQIPTYHKNVPPWGNIMVDVNFDIFWGEYEGKRVDIEDFLSDTMEIDIYGKKIRTLPPVKALIQLILHHYKDLNSIFLLATSNGIKKAMFKDVYFLFKNNTDQITLESLYSLAVEYEIIPYVYYVLYCTGQFYDDALLKRYIETFKTDEGAMLLDYYGLCSMERKKWRYDFMTRMTTDNIYMLIKNDLTDRDRQKILINKHALGWSTQ